MEDLRKYPAEIVQSMAATIKFELEAGVLTLEQLTDALSDLKFRDGSGAYWTQMPRSGQWYHYENNVWNRTDGVPSASEGLASIAMWAPTIPEKSSSAKTVIAGRTASNAHEFMKNRIENIAQRYNAGEISSLAAHSLVANVFLMDQAFHFWAPGFQTENWYVFENAKWQQKDSPPDLGTLIDSNSQELAEEIDKATLDFLSAMAGNLPEPVTDPWNPPSGIPEPALKCPVCNRTDVGTHTHCRFCGTELPPVVQEMTKFCTSCGHEQPRRMKFCTQCGNPF